MNTCLFLVLVMVLILLFFRCYKDSFAADALVRTKISSIKNNLKSGDILLMRDEKGQVKDMHLLYRRGGKIKVVTVNQKGDLMLASIFRVVNKSPYAVYAFRLNHPLTIMQQEAMDTLVRRNYAGLNVTNCAFQGNNKQYFYKCKAYIPMILSRLGVINTGIDYECVYNADPKCFQEFYHTTVYLNKNLFKHEVYQLKDH